MKKFIFSIVMAMLAAMLISCTANQLSGTYICVNSGAQVSKIVFDKKQAQVTDLGMVVDCSYEVEDGVLYMSGTGSLFGTKSAVEYEYAVEFAEDSIYLDGEEYNRTGKKSDNKVKHDGETEKENSSAIKETETMVSYTDINPFDGLVLIFEGIDTCGTAELDKSGCDPFVQKNVKFSFEGKSLANGDVVTVTAAYDSGIFENNQYHVSADTMDFTVYGLQEIKYLDPFEGLELLYSGISPYCSVSINDAQCDSDVQKYVRTELPQNVKNGDPFTIRRYLEGGVTEKYGIALTETEREYTMTEMPYFLESLDGVDISAAESELADYVTANTSVTTDTREILGVYISDVIHSGGYFTNNVSKCSTSVKLISQYFRVRKASYQDEFSWGDTRRFNSCIYLYEIEVNSTYRGEEYTGKMYGLFEIPNLIQYPDGTIKWGYNSYHDYDFAGTGNKLYENLESQWIHNIADKYNYTKIYSE